MSIKTFLLAMILLLASPSLSLANGYPNQSKEINSLRKKIISLTNQHKKIINKNELRQNHRLARYQAELLMQVTSYEVQAYLRKQGIRRSFGDIEKMVQASYLSSWVFTDLGQDHIERFVRINQWAKDETGFKSDTITFWKKGTYLASIDKTVHKDTKDYGGWQINEMHEQNIKLLNFLYDSGIVNFKIKRIGNKTALQDVMDINTNCVARCIIETDRKNRGWEWHHTRDKKFNAHLRKVIARMETKNLYDRAFVSKYYYITPISKYTAGFSRK